MNELFLSDTEYILGPQSNFESSNEINSLKSLA